MHSMPSLLNRVAFPLRIWEHPESHANDDLRDPADQKKVKINRRQPWDQGWYLEKGAQRQEHLTEQRNHEKTALF